VAEVLRRKPIRFVGSAQSDLRKFPKEVKIVVGAALTSAQLGGKHAAAKPMRGFHGSSVVEIVDDFDGDSYRAVYTVRFAEVVYVLHALQKKSKRGIETPKSDIDLIKLRLKMADADYRAGRES
jgi:phage-related protein